MDRLIESWMREHLFTTQEEKDPSMPLIENAAGFIEANPEYDPTGLQRIRGTSFFINFDPARQYHQYQGNFGDNLRYSIMHQLRDRLMRAFDVVLEGKEGWLHVRERLERSLQIDLCPTRQDGFNNGEVYLWLKKHQLLEDIVLRIISEWRKQLTARPVIVEIHGEQHEVSFYGWGFRYY